MKVKGAQKVNSDAAAEKAEGPADLECACFTCPSQEACKAAQEAEKAAPAEEKIDFSNVEIEPLFKDYVDFETFSKSDFRAVKVLNCEAVPKSKKLLKFTLDDGTGENRTILSGMGLSIYQYEKQCFMAEKGFCDYPYPEQHNPERQQEHDIEKEPDRSP